MACRIASDLEAGGKVHALAAVSQENTEAIERYRDKVLIVKTPKKGGTGLKRGPQEHVPRGQGPDRRHRHLRAQAEGMLLR